jgi:RsiW-degrading membrane proteinase PrsW (M82 family)
VKIAVAPFTATRIGAAATLIRQRNAICVEETVTRSNMLYLVIGALAVAVAVLSYQLYRDRHQPEGVHIDLGPGGLSIQGQGKK